MAGAEPLVSEAVERAPITSTGCSLASGVAPTERYLGGTRRQGSEKRTPMFSGEHPLEGAGDAVNGTADISQGYPRAYTSSAAAVAVPAFGALPCLARACSSAARTTSTLSCRAPSPARPDAPDLARERPETATDLDAVIGEQPLSNRRLLRAAGTWTQFSVGSRRPPAPASAAGAASPAMSAAELRRWRANRASSPSS